MTVQYFEVEPNVATWKGADEQGKNCERKVRREEGLLCVSVYSGIHWQVTRVTAEWQSPSAGIVSASKLQPYYCFPPKNRTLKTRPAELVAPDVLESTNFSGHYVFFHVCVFDSLLSIDQRQSDSGWHVIRMPDRMATVEINLKFIALLRSSLGSLSLLPGTQNLICKPAYQCQERRRRLTAPSQEPLSSEDGGKAD